MSIRMSISINTSRRIQYRESIGIGVIGISISTSSSISTGISTGVLV